MITLNLSDFRSPGSEICFDQPNRRIRTRMYGGVGGGSCEAPSYPDSNREGKILDGNSLEHSFQEIDNVCSSPPLGYMINCAYPSFLHAEKQPRSVLSRLIGYQANASSLDHSHLDGAGILQTNDICYWGNLMIELNKKFGVRILGGCCGTGYEHLQYIVRNINSEHM